MDPHQDKVLMEVILSSIQVVLNKGKELVVVEVVVMIALPMADLVVVVEAQVHVLVKLVDHQVNHPHLDQEQITEIEEEIITHLVMVGHQLEEEVQVGGETVGARKVKAATARSESRYGSIGTWFVRFEAAHV